MKKWILFNWLVLAITSFLTGLYISIFEHFISDKAYLYFTLFLLFGFIYYRQLKK